MSKKILFILVIIVLILAIILIKPKKSFKEEYESLNGQKTENNQDYLTVNIPKDNPIVYSDYKTVFKVLDESGIIYFGFPECPWCRNAVPILLEAADEAGIEKIYYMNNLEDRDIKKLEDGKIVTEKEATKDYEKLLKKLEDKVSTYDGLDDESVKRLYFPTVIVVKNGEITDYIEGTVDTQEDPYIPLNKKQKQELKEKYINAFNKTLMCNINSQEKC